METGPASLSTTARLVALATAVGCGVGAMPSVAWAQPSEAAPARAPAAKSTRAAILPLVVEGDPMPDADREQLAGRLVEGLERGAFEVVPPAEILAASASAARCRSAECYTAIAKAVGASHLVLAVVKVEDRDYQVEVVLVDGSDGSQVATTDDSCQICGVAEVGDLIDTAASTLRTKLDNVAQGPASLVVSSTPVGASVSIDGELKGTTPFNAPVIAGKHVLRIALEGYITVEREVEFVEGIEDVQRFDLEKVPSRLPARPWAWVSLGVGAAALGASATLAYLDDRQFRVGNNCEVEINGQCPRLWDTDWGVLGTAVAGGALVTLGVAILLSTAKGRDKKAASGKRAKRAETARLPLRERLRWGVGAGRISVQGRF